MAISCWSVFLLHAAEATRWLINQRHSRREEGVTGETERRGEGGKAPAQRCARGRGGGGGEAGLEGEMLLGTKSDLTSLIMDRQRTN